MKRHERMSLRIDAMKLALASLDLDFNSELLPVARSIWSLSRAHPPHKTDEDGVFQRFCRSHGVERVREARDWMES